MVRLVSTAACLVALAGRTAALRAKTAVIALELNATLLNATLDAASNATTPADAPRSTTAAVPAEKDAARGAENEATKDAPENAPENATKNAQEIAAKNATQEAPESEAKNAAKEAPKGAAKDAAKSAPKNAAKKVQESDAKNAAKGATKRAPRSAARSPARSAPKNAARSAPKSAARSAPKSAAKSAPKRPPKTPAEIANEVAARTAAKIARGVAVKNATKTTPKNFSAPVGRPEKSAAKDAANDAAKTEAGVVHFDGPFRQEMQNHWDLQYTASLKVGGQQVQGILDTGSFDLLVFSRGCGNCGAAAAYDEHRSQDVKFGKRNRDQNYGSGSCTAVDALDKVQVGNAVVPQQDMWMAKDCQMPVLESASFSAIVGIGPPGHLRRAADNRLSETKKLEEAYISDGMEVPPTVKDSIRQAHEDIEDSAKKVELLMSLGVQRISACYGRHAGSPAWLVWNDIKRADEPGVYQVPIKGILTWGVEMGAVGLVDESGKQSAMSCQDGCGAIIDTGTSLIGVPSIIYNRITEELSPDGDTVDCGSISRMPRLLVTLGGKAFHLHPSTYVGKMYNSLNQESVGFMRSTTEAERQPAMRCSLLLMDLGGRKTQFGPMFILGIPFMREFYTTFDLGTGPEDRSLFLSAANDQCSPDGKTVEVDRRERRLLTVDASKIRVPDWVKSNEHYMTI